jgi:hypothetical protein
MKGINPSEDERRWPQKRRRLKGSVYAVSSGVEDS